MHRGGTEIGCMNCQSRSVIKRLLEMWKLMSFARTSMLDMGRLLRSARACATPCASQRICQLDASHGTLHGTVAPCLCNMPSFPYLAYRFLNICPIALIFIPAYKVVGALNGSDEVAEVVICETEAIKRPP